MIMNYYTNFFLKRELYSCPKKGKDKSNGYSVADLSIAIMIIGILATLLIPNFSSALEFVEVLIAEKHLNGAVKDCQKGLINDEMNPQYDLPFNDVGVGIFKNNKFSFSYTGIEGECFGYLEPNQIRLSKMNNNQSNIDYSLIINLITGERISEGILPEWLTWWEDFYSPLIPENDQLLDGY